MKKMILLLGAVGVLMMTGCADEGITTDYGEWVATSEYSMDGITENYRTIEADATAEKTEAASEKEMEGSSDHMNTQKKDSTTEKTDGTEEARYSCENYTFYRVNDDVDMAGSYLLLNVYEDEALAEYHGLFIGQIVTLFGDKETTENNEELLDYTIAAEDKNGKVIYLTLYYGASGPAIGGFDGDEYMAAAEELEKLVRTTEPIDYECASVYEDLGMTIRMGTRNGRGFYETEMPEGMEDFYNDMY